jgi:hypothetical protein
MASSMRNDLQAQSVPDEDVTAAKDETTLDLGHAGLVSECWPGARRKGSGTGSNVMAAPSRSALRLRRPAPRRMCRCPRPSQPAEARFTADDSQFLTVMK